MSGTKICNKCEKEKSSDNFGNNRKICKQCIVDYQKEYHIKNKEKIAKQRKEYREQEQTKEKWKEYQKEYHIKNKEKIAKQRKEYREKNKDKMKEYREKNKDKIKKQSKEYKENNKEHLQMKRKEYREKNKEIINIKQNIRRKKRYHNDALFRVSINIRGAVNRVCFGGVKTGKSIDLVGCDNTFLMNHLESLFTYKMNWNNYGTYWHIDHIKPISSFHDLAVDPLQQRLCCNWRNLQPLEANENLSKSDKWDSSLEENIKHEEYLTEALIGLDISGK